MYQLGHRGTFVGRSAWSGLKQSDRPGEVTAQLVRHPVDDAPAAGPADRSTKYVVEAVRHDPDGHSGAIDAKLRSGEIGTDR